MSAGVVKSAVSVRARLLNIARRDGANFNQILVRFALERMLYRLSTSRHADRFLLKGALLFTLWYDMPHRPTRDMDLLGIGPSDLASVKDVFRELAAASFSDGMEFDPASVSVAEICKQSDYGGVRVNIAGHLAGARCLVQVDVGFGDAVTPEPEESTFPVLLADLPAPRLRMYPVYTVIAEKSHAITMLGMGNGRLKDYYDLSVLFQRETLEPELIARAIKATFERRGTALPSDLPIGFTSEFSDDASRQTVWRSFLKKNHLPDESLRDVVLRLHGALEPSFRMALEEGVDA